jgi:hypothetical protein
MKQNGMQIGEHINGVYVHTSMITKISPLACYICTNCGYFENYLVDPNKLADVAQKWKKVA